MKKSTLNIFILLLAWIAFVMPTVMQATAKPIVLKTTFMAEIKDAMKPEVTSEEVSKIVTGTMEGLCEQYKDGFGEEYFPCTTVFLTCKPIVGAEYSTLEIFLKNLKERSSDPWKKDTKKKHFISKSKKRDLEDFCEGFYYGTKYVEGKCSPQQIIEDFRKLNPDDFTGKYKDEYLPYFSGVNTAVYPGKFPWDNKAYYAKQVSAKK